MDNTPFYVKVNEQAFEISPEQLSNFDAVEIHNGQFHILKNNRAFRAELLEADFANKLMRISVNGNKYEVKISDKYDRLIEKIGITADTNQKQNNIKSPMPGLVLSINSSVGQQVEKGDTLLILEAMKMENVIKSPTDGIIKEIKVAQGNPVEKGQLLITFED